MIENHNINTSIECQAGKPPRIFPVAKKIEMMQTYDRAWAYFMSMHASHVFRTVLSDDTISWSRPSVTVTYAEIATRCNISISTVRRAIKDLREFGLVETVPSGRGLVYHVMMEVLMGREIPVPKRVRLSNMDTQSVQYEQPECSNRTLSNISIISDIKTSETARKQTTETTTASRSRSQDAVDHGRKVNDDSRRKTLHRTRKSATALEETWRKYHDTPPTGWTVRHRAVVKELVKVWPGTIPELHAFLGWCVTEWAYIMASEFRWMRDTPDAPDVHLIKRFVDKFREAREQNIGQAWRDGPHAEEIADLFMAGKDNEARALIGDDNG